MEIPAADELEWLESNSFFPEEEDEEEFIVPEDEDEVQEIHALESRGKALNLRPRIDLSFLDLFSYRPCLFFFARRSEPSH